MWSKLFVSPVKKAERAPHMKVGFVGQNTERKTVERGAGGANMVPWVP